jgi:RimJ/RimL family protein N-acetyltransferase
MEQKTYTLNDGKKISMRSLIKEDRNKLANLYENMSESALKWIQKPEHYQLKERFRYPDYYISLVTLHNEDLIGYGEIQKDPMKRDGELLIHIHQDYQGVGLGTAMMIMLLKEATDQGLHSIKLKVAAENRKAVHLFSKFGFQEQHTTMEVYDGEKHDTLYMSKQLKK